MAKLQKFLKSRGIDLDEQMKEEEEARKALAENDAWVHASINAPRASITVKKTLFPEE